MPAIQGITKGVRPVVVALLLVTVAHIAPKSVFTWETLLIAIACFAVVYFLDVHPIYTIIAAGIFGFFYYKD